MSTPGIKRDGTVLGFDVGARRIGVAVELIDGAISLPEYEHPKRAFYVFGGEHMTLGRPVFSWCRDRIFIPSQGSLNLGACVNVVLYDRLCKQLQAASGSSPELNPDRD